MLKWQEQSKRKDTQISIIIPTYNESQNIIQILKTIGENLPMNTIAGAIVVDDNSPDGTGKIVEDYMKNLKKFANYTIDVIHRKAKAGLSSAILYGIQQANGEAIVVMDSDFSHPPQIIPKMIEALKKYKCDIVVASRYVKGGKIDHWSLKRKILSKVGTKIAKKFLKIETKDPMSGFFAFKRNIISGLNFDAIGCKMLLEILVKTKEANVKEIPYTFTNRRTGSSKLDFTTLIDYAKSVRKLYLYGQSNQKQEQSRPVRFISKVGRFYTVGASGLVINYLISILSSLGISELWYLHSNLIGIMVSMTSNFFLNKFWTFEDRDLSLRRTSEQYAKFIGFCSLGVVIQLTLVYYLVDGHHIYYPFALITAILIAAFSNFILNKKWTFKEKIW